MITAEIDITCKWDTTLLPIPPYTDSDIVNTIETVSMYKLVEARKSEMCWKVLVDEKGNRIARVVRTPSDSSEKMGALTELEVLSDD